MLIQVGDAKWHSVVETIQSDLFERAARGGPHVFTIYDFISMIGTPQFDMSVTDMLFTYDTVMMHTCNYRISGVLMSSIPANFFSWANDHCNGLVGFGISENNLGDYFFTSDHDATLFKLTFL